LLIVDFVLNIVEEDHHGVVQQQELLLRSHQEGVFVVSGVARSSIFVAAVCEKLFPSDPLNSKNCYRAIFMKLLLLFQVLRGRRFFVAAVCEKLFPSNLGSP
jgi:hypothetical protein